MPSPEVMEYIRQNYGYLAWVLEHPELGPLIESVIEGGGGVPEVEAAIRQSKWWTENEKSYRDYDSRLHSDPGQLESEVQSTVLDFRIQAARMGIELDDARLRKMAEDSIRFSWSDNQLRQAFAAEAKYSPKVQGEIGATRDSLRAKARDWHVGLSDETLNDWTRKFAEGTASDATFTKWLSDMAVAQYPHLKDIIAQGTSPSQFFQPYREMASSLLEMPIESIDLLNDSRFSPITQFADDSGKVRPMTRSEVARHLRKLPEWRKTDDARRQASSLSLHLLKSFGKVA